MSTTIWAASAVTPAGTDRIPVDVSGAGGPSRWTGQQVADVNTLIGGTVTALGSIGTNTALNLALGGYFSATITGNLTFSITNVPASAGVTFVLALTNGGAFTVTLPGSVTIIGGSPVLSAAGTDWLVFRTLDGGTAWTLEVVGNPRDADLATWATITPGTGVGTALAVNVGSAGAVVTNGGALGTPSSGTLTNCTFPTLNQNTSGYAEALRSATTTVSVSAATAPTSGQVLTATSGAAATWQTPAAGSPAGSSGQMQYNDASAFGAANLWRVDANTLWQYNGTTAQLFYVGNTWTDGSNYERGAVKWVSNALWLTTEKAGTGTSRQLKIGVDNVATFTILTNGVAQCAGMDLTGSYGLNAGTLPIYAYRHMQYANTLTSYTFVSGDYGTEYVATSASDQNYTMVASSSTHSGRWVTFYLGAAKAGSYLRFTANTGQKIRLQAGASASAGYVRSNTAGSWLTLRYNHTDAEWVATSQGGTWTIDS